jgi:hypothetical protein
MGELLRSGQVGNIQLKQLQEQRTVIAERWERTGLLEGLKGTTKGTISQLLENQAGYLLEANTTSDIMGFDIIAFPMVRRVFSRLLANEIVSVQPMNLPSGLLFYLDAQVSTNNPTNTTYESVYNSHYNNGGHEYSFGTATTVNAAVTATTGGMTVTVPYSGGEDSLASLQIYVSSGAAVTSDSATTTFAISPQTWTQDLFRNNLIAVTIPEDTPSTAPGGGGVAIAGVRAVYNTYKDLEGSSEMTELKLTVSSVTVQVTSRKMKAHWTPELAQDLAAYHSVDAEAELTALLSEELAAEIDREIIRDLINVAPWKTVWQYSRSAVITNQIGTSIPGDPASGYITQKEWNQTLLTQINKISAQIHKSTLRGGANWIVCSTEVASVIDDIEKFHGMNEPTDEQFNLGIEKVGTLASRYTVYKDPYLPTNICLIGHKGNNFLETGYVYAPYIPFQLTPVVLDPDDFTPRKGIMTRYAKKVVNNKFYGLVDVSFPTSYYVVNANEWNTNPS